MKIKLLGLASVCALAAAAPSLASGPPIVARILAVGKTQATTIDVKAGTTVLDSIKIKPGGSFGWHTHGSPVAVVVTAGTLTVLDPTVAGCSPFKVSKGQSFVEPANHVHLARNDGKTSVTVYALYLGLPGPSAANSLATEPDSCRQ